MNYNYKQFVSEETEEYKKKQEMFEQKKISVSIPGVVTILTNPQNGKPIEVVEQPKKRTSSSAKSDPFASRIKYQYKKFDPRPEYFFKFTEKITIYKNVDYNHVDFEATQADIEFIQSMKGKIKITLDQFEQIIDLFEKC